MGFSVTVSMNLGMIVGWAFLSPLSKKMGWAPGPVSSTINGARGWIVSSTWSAHGLGIQLTKQLWVALAIMISEALISLIPPLISSFQRQLSHLRQNKRPTRIFSADGSARNSNEGARDDYYEPMEGEPAEDAEHEPPNRLVPLPWVLWGLGGSGVLGVGLVWYVFGDDGIKPWATAAGLLLASGLAVVGVRALGETDINPVSLSRPYPAPKLTSRSLE